MNTRTPSEYRKGELLCLVLLHLPGCLLFDVCGLQDGNSKALNPVWEVMKGVLWKLKQTCESFYDFLSLPAVCECNAVFYDTGQ